MSGNSINLFMWGYQQHFRISAEVAANNLFSLLDKKFTPRVFLVGVLVDERSDRHPVCLEPEDCGFKVKSFANIESLAKELEKADKETRIIHSHPVAQKNCERGIRMKAYVDAISKILLREDYLEQDDRFISLPTYVDGYLVFVVLELNNDVLRQYYSLNKTTNENGLTIYRSLIESVIYTFFGTCQNALKDPEKAINVIDRNADELIREAGRKFMYTASQAGNNFDGLHGLYDACNEIASMRYEGAIGLGKIIIAPKNHKNIKITLGLKTPIMLSEHRKVRKFLELSDGESSIVSDSALIYGLGEIKGKYNPREESLFVVSFTSHYTWELSHDNNPLMVVSYREPRLPVEKIDREKFYDILERIFEGIPRGQIDSLWDTAMEATKQRHGTMLVISEKAIQESERLGNQCFPVEPLILSKEFIHQITSIDGAVLLDKSGICHAVGVILDGIASEKGDASRGARYNSAIRYYEQFGKIIATVIVIISEDGMINLVPNLKPRIKRSIITEIIRQFKEMLDKQSFDRKEFNKAMSFFNSYNFYLTPKECELINEVRPKLEALDTDTSIRLVYSDFRHNEEMNSSYYLDE